MAKEVVELLTKALAPPIEARAALLVLFLKPLMILWTPPPRRNGTKRLRAGLRNWIQAE